LPATKGVRVGSHAEVILYETHNEILCPWEKAPQVCSSPSACWVGQVELAVNVYDIERNAMKMKSRYKGVDLLHDGIVSRRELAQT
jgi:hypothetical protein